MKMKKILTLMLTISVFASFATSCKDDETYADQKKKERKAIQAFVARDPLVLLNASNDTLLNIPKIKVISQEQFEAQDSTTNVSKNEFVLFSNTGIYMQIVRKGVGEKIKHGETKRVLCRYWEYNILGDSLQTTNKVPYYIANYELLDVSNNSGTISASFNTDHEILGSMYLTYGETSVPFGWRLPLSYVGVGRQTDDEGIALVRLIVPHSQGTTNAMNNVCPFFYEISYQEVRE